MYLAVEDTEIRYCHAHHSPNYVFNIQVYIHILHWSDMMYKHVLRNSPLGSDIHLGVRISGQSNDRFYLYVH